MRRLHRRIFVPLLFFIASTNGHASTLLFANLTNPQENPPATPTLAGGSFRPASFGTETLTLNEAMTAMTFSAQLQPELQPPTRVLYGEVLDLLSAMITIQTTSLTLHSLPVSAE